MKVVERTNIQNDIHISQRRTEGEQALWVEVVKQAVRDLHVPAKRQRDAVSRIEKAYTFFTSRAFREDREMVLQFAGMEAGPFVERLRPKLREVETFLGALRGAAV